MPARYGAWKSRASVVTGANAGIGEAAAVQFAEGGATVYGVARRKEALEAARKKHPQVRWLLADVAMRAQISTAIESAVREAGRLDVLVNNAAIFYMVPLEATTEEMARSQFEVNVLGASHAAQAALPALKASRGVIVNLSSAAGHKAMPVGSHYGATKAAIESLTRSWALELAPHGVRVNAIAPGPTETEGFAKLAPAPEARQQVKASFTKMVPLGRMASGAEVARFILAVSEPAAAWMTGEILRIDGGMSL